MRRSVPVAAVAAVALLSSAACSSSSGGKPAASSTSATAATSAKSTPSTSASSPTAFPSTTAVTTPSSSESITVAEIQSVLLTAKEISPTATATPAPATDTPLPCSAAGAPSLEQQVPSTVRAGVDISDDTLMAAVSEEIRIYADDATAAKALAAAKAGLACKSGDLTADDGTKLAVTIGAPQDIKADLLKDTKLASTGIEDAQAWSASSSTDQFGLVSVKIARSLVLFTFVNATGADTSKLPSPLSVIQLALEKGN